MIIRKAVINDLDAINLVIEKAIMTWQLPERVKRLAMQSYFYNDLDLQHMEMSVAEENGEIVGVAALETVTENIAVDQTGMLLHGIYIDPAHHRTGIGSQLFEHVAAIARKHQADGLLVKAQKDAEEFYRAKGFKKMEVMDPAKDFENRYWKQL